MNRGFRFYFAQAMRASNKSLWKKGNILKYLAYFIMSCLAAFTFVLSPMFRLADVRQAKIAAKENTVDIPQSFKVACRAKPFFTMLLATVLEALLFIAGLILIGIAACLLGVVGYAVSLFVTEVPPMLIMYVFLAPGGLAIAVYSIVMALLFAPTAYVVETNPDMGAANAVSICINTMKSRGKWTYFITLFVTFLIEFLILAVGAGVEAAVILFIDDVRLSVVLAVLVGIVFFVGFALVAPMFGLARKVTVYSLFDDVVLDPVNASKRTDGVNIRRCKGVKFDPAQYENELSALFDETYSDRVPVPETDRARRKRLLKERKAAKSAPVQEYVAPAPAAPYEAPAKAPATAQPEPTPVTQPVDADEEDGEILTVSDLIRDVEPAPDAPEELPTEAPVEASVAPAPVAPEVPAQSEAPEEAPSTAQTEPATTPTPATETPAPEAPTSEEPAKGEPDGDGTAK